jgi:hypothetical protein
MDQTDWKKIRRLRQLYSQGKKTTLAYAPWVATFFWDFSAKEQLTDFLQPHIKRHSSITSVSSSHPMLQEHTPIHLPYLYRHDISFEDGSLFVLFQKFNFSWDFTSLFTSLTWSYLPQLSATFRRHHRQYEKRLGRSRSLVHPHPRSLWEHYTMFLSTMGTSWKAKETTSLGPTWVVLTDVTAVTLAVPGKNQAVGSSMYTHLVNAIHRSRFQKKQYESLGESLGKAIRSCYTQKVAFIDIGLGNYILDSEDGVRFLDGEFFQVFPKEVPSHYKALELVLFMENLYVEMVRDYCRTINSKDSDVIRKYQQGLLVFFSSFLKELDLSNHELILAQGMYHDWSTKIGTFCFTVFLSLHWNTRVMSSFRLLLKEDLGKILQKHISS